jgi:hypothetical protein
MTYARPDWEFEADTHLLKLQRLRNRVLRITGKFPRNTPVRNMHVAFQIPYVYDYISNYAGNKHKLFKIMKIHIFAILDKTMPDTALGDPQRL